MQNLTLRTTGRVTLRGGAWRPLRTGSTAAGSHFDQACLDRQWQVLIGPYFQAKTDGLLDIRQGLVLRRTLRHAPWNGRAFHDPDPILVPVDRHVESHGAAI